jgi:signal transduction histidine kinase
MELAGMGLVTLDRTGKVTWMSASMKQLFSIPENCACSDCPKWKDLIQIEGESVWSDELEAEFHEKGCLRTDGYCDVKNRGRIALEISMCHDAQSGERLVMVRDVTDSDRGKQELEIEKANAEFLNRALEREIQKANQLAVMAERANIAKSVFLTSMSHEFRTPLNGVLGYSQILTQDPNLNPENQRAVATIERCGRHLLSLINDVLDLSKIEAGRVELANAPINLRLLVDEVMDVFKMRAQAKGIQLNLSWDQALQPVEWVKGDAKVLRQVLINLLGNALKFTESGSVCLNLSSPGNGATAQHPLRIEVSDTGPGIAEADLEQIFEEFYQTEAFSGHKGGTGLGLTISRRLVQAMGSTLKVRSRLGHGSTFWFDWHPELITETQAIQLPPKRTPLARASKPASYLQLFAGEQDSGVMRRIFGGIGFECHVIEDLSGEMIRSKIQSTPLAVIALMSSMLRSEHSLLLQSLMRGNWATPVVWVIYLDGSGNDLPTVEACLGNTSHILTEMPVDLAIFQEQLQQRTPGCWQVRQDLPSAETKQTKQPLPLSDDLPPLQLLRHMIRDAQIGDLRSFQNRVKEWNQSLTIPSAFANEVTILAEAYRIDQLCKLLDAVEAKQANPPGS